MGEVRVEQRRISETTTIRGCFESEKPLKSTPQLHSQIRLFFIERLGYVKAGSEIKGRGEEYTNNLRGEKVTQANFAAIKS